MLKKTVMQLLRSKLFFDLLLQQQHSSPHIYYVYVDPKEISHISLLPGNSYRLTGPSAAYGAFKGYFDLIKKPFKKDAMYLTIEELMRGKNWSLTPHFKKIKKKHGEKRAISQFEKIERLIEILSTEGYKSQYELGRVDITRKIYHWDVPLHEMIIGMDRNGKLFRIIGGRHRLAIAQHIDIPVMPAILTLYHRNAVNMLPEERRKVIGSNGDFSSFE